MFDAVASHLLQKAERWLGEGRRSPGVIDALDLNLIRRLLLGASGQGSNTLSQAGRAFLLRLHREALEFTDSEGWHAFFTNALGGKASFDLHGDEPGRRELVEPSLG